jgi:hypothetical protein
LSPAFAPCGIPPEAPPLVDVAAVEVEAADEGVDVADAEDVELEPPPQPASASAATSNAAAARRAGFELGCVTDTSWFRAAYGKGRLSELFLSTRPKRCPRGSMIRTNALRL